MNRRAFIAGLTGAAAWPLVARGQQPAMPVVGFLSGASPGGAFAGALSGFRKGLAETGYEEGRNLTIEYRFGEGRYESLPALAEELVRLNVAAVFAGASDIGVRAAKTATTNIPIVFTTATDPIDSGLVNSLSRPVGNITGVTMQNYRVEPKRLELFHELVPKANPILVLTNPNNLITAPTERSLQAAAASLGIAVDIIGAGSDNEIEAVFAQATERKVSAIFIMGDPYFSSRHDKMAVLAARHALPACSSTPDFPAAGGLMSYGANLPDVYRQAGVYIGRILKGAKTQDLPVTQPTKFDFVINLRAAKMLGLSVPQTLLVAADEVIE